MAWVCYIYIFLTRFSQDLDLGMWNNGFTLLYI